ncbi:uncharacterized protein TNCT_694111 [Trichonephila clavata]|uniref:DUF4371 domain-containing protein n=1 Tax=Trichonephila clavata TaxID=2740835 RepID=A0A8X6F8N6_TRICU|nr:uncharacterized protein TNCT_694111 [Trichonephila clavata]
MIVRKLKADGLDIMNCRGQAYDNAATIAGCHTGVQQRIKDINPNVEFVPCSNHSLNLICINVASVEGVPKKLGQNDKADQSYNNDQRSHRNMGSQTPVEGARTREGVAVQTRAEQKEVEFIRVVDALGVTWLVTHTANWLTCI